MTPTTADAVMDDLGDERRYTGCGHPAWLECGCLCCPYADGSAEPMAGRGEAADFT